MQSNLSSIQKQLAGKTKLTAVTLRHNGKLMQTFLHLQHDSKGNAVLDAAIADNMCNAMRITRGDTFTVG